MVRIRRTVVHGEGWHGKAAGRIVVQDMLCKRSGEHVLWSPNGGGKNHLRRGAAPKGGYMVGTGRGKRPARSDTYWGTGVGGRWSLLGSLCTRRLTTLMDWQGDLFLEWASPAFGDGERRGSGELPEDSSSSTGRLISFGVATSLTLLGRGGENRWEGSRDCSARPTSNWVRKWSFSSRNQFPCSRSSTTFLASSSCLASISWSQRRNWSPGAKFAGLLVMALNSDGLMGYLGTTKALQIGRSPGSGCTQALAYCL